MNKNSYDWTNLFEINLRLLKVQYESMIAEIVDNSMDNNAENVLIRFTGMRWDEFTTIILDDGTGFKSPQTLLESFDLAIQNVSENELGNKKITGINDIGMKLTPLSYADSVTVITRFEDGKIGFRTLSRESAIRDGDYQTDNTRQQFAEFSPTLKLIENGKWNTAVIVHNHHKEAFSGSPKIPRKYCQNLAKFLGITYSKILDDGRIKLNNISIQHRNEKDIWDKDIIQVMSLDPFWSRFTPQNILNRIESNVYDKFKKSDHDLMTALVEFGTVTTPRRTIPIVSNKDGKTYDVYLQAYIIPPQNARSKIPKSYSNGCFNAGIAKCGTPILQKEHTAGFYFYRNKRCISFGTSGFAKNKGFYKLLSSPDNQQLDIRIKVEFPQQLDKNFDLEPTKNGVTPPDSFFDSVMEALRFPIQNELLRGNITGSKNRTPFFDVSKNPKSLSTTLSSKCTAQKFVKDKNLKTLVDCKYCKYFHHKDTICKVCNFAKKEEEEKESAKKKHNTPIVKPIKKHAQITLPKSLMEPNSSKWTIVLDENTPEKNREAILKAIKKFNIKLD